MVDLWKENISYSPVVPFKEGEKRARKEIRHIVRDRTLAQVQIPSPRQSDGEALLTGNALGSPQMSLHEVGHYWWREPCILDLRALYRTLGAEDSPRWLPYLFESALSTSALPIPTLETECASGPLLSAIRSAIDLAATGLCIRVTFSELFEEEPADSLVGIALRMGLSVDDVVLIVDFSDANLSESRQAQNADILADFLPTVVEKASKFGSWKAVRGFSPLLRRVDILCQAVRR